MKSWELNPKNINTSLSVRLSKMMNFVNLLHMHAAHVGGVTYKPGLSNTHRHTVVRSSLQLSAHQSLWREFLTDSAA